MLGVCRSVARNSSGHHLTRIHVQADAIWKSMTDPCVVATACLRDFRHTCTSFDFAPPQPAADHLHDTCHMHAAALPKPAAVPLHVNAPQPVAELHCRIECYMLPEYDLHAADQRCCMSLKPQNPRTNHLPQNCSWLLARSPPAEVQC